VLALAGIVGAVRGLGRASLCSPLGARPGPSDFSQARGGRLPSRSTEAAVGLAVDLFAEGLTASAECVSLTSVEMHEHEHRQHGRRV
jgi:hypothetical protein